MERLRTNAILKAKADAELTTSTIASLQPLRGNRSLLAPEPGMDILENRFLKFAHVPTRRI